MRTLVIGDIHSGLQALKQLLKKTKVTPKDHLIFLGDYVDSWSEAFETVTFLMQLDETHNCTFIRGNHDDLCWEWMKTGIENKTWLMHGGAATKKSYEAAGKKKWDTHLAFYARLKSYYLDKDNRLFLHAGFTNLKGIEHEYFEKMFYWDRTLWELAQTVNGRLTREDKHYPKRLTNYKEIFIGHTPISKTSFCQPFNAANVWNVDTGAAFKGPLTALDVNSKEFWQTDAVQSFYPLEKGRN
ncbi:metallophosphatase [Croceivirga lutea]|uniref:metallophosphoesterase family protein n=1 Tax=Croceivirga lutea TaxID=1775167 RepID=UPI00163A10AA|nr:metallophosphoesterase family protein [Croceivirga lutea]GGG37873.1 metallophosphatase [Croceivirga lutea]